MRRSRRKSLPTTPFTLEIEKLSHAGQGIAHREGKVIFIAGALPGEKVDVLLVSRRHNFDEARLVEIHKAAPERVEAPCQYADICGGCSLQHFDPAAQLAFKESMLFEKLSHAVPNQSFQALPPLTGPVLDYRRKARLAVRYVQKKNQVLVGFREKGSSFITQMDSCEVLDQRIAVLLPELSALIGSLQSYLHIPQIEVAAGDPELPGPTTAFVFRHLQPLPDSDQDSLIEFAREKGIAIYLQPGGAESVHKIYPVGGKDRLFYRLQDFDMSMGFHPMDFTQVNADINRKMISQALTLLQLTKEDTVLDLFSGLGNFTLPIARQCRQVTGIEGSGAMVDRADENAAANNVSNAYFHCADLTKAMKGAEWVKTEFSKVLLDPPRSGAFEILPDVAALRPERIVYISCNPATLARDAGYLVQQGYTLARAGVMDMFPHTAHVEAMALFQNDRS